MHIHVCTVMSICVSENIYVSAGMNIHTLVCHHILAYVCAFICVYFYIHVLN